MAMALLILLIGIYVTVGLSVSRYSRRTRMFLLGVSTALPGLAYFFL